MHSASVFGTICSHAILCDRVDLCNLGSSKTIDFMSLSSFFLADMLIPSALCSPSTVQGICILTRDDLGQDVDPCGPQLLGHVDPVCWGLPCHYAVAGISADQSHIIARKHVSEKLLVSNHITITYN